MEFKKSAKKEVVVEQVAKDFPVPVARSVAILAVCEDGGVHVSCAADLNDMCILNAHFGHVLEAALRSQNGRSISGAVE